MSFFPCIKTKNLLAPEKWPMLFAMLKQHYDDRVKRSRPSQEGIDRKLPTSVGEFAGNKKTAIGLGCALIGQKSEWLKTKTGIAWTDATFNPVWGCTKVSEGCRNCYAADVARAAGYGGPGYARHGKPFLWGQTGETAEGKGWKVIQGRRVFGPDYWNQLIKWNTRAEKAGMIVAVFVASMADMFEDHPTTRRELEKFWVYAKQCKHLHFQMLTKRPENIAENLPKDWWDYTNGYENVWLGTTVENQAAAYRFDDILAEIPTASRWASYEPAIGPVELKRMDKLDWIIVGGESGSNRRPFDHQWARDIHAACKEHGVPFFYKQDSAYRSSSNPYLDGKVYKEFPIPRESTLIKPTSKIVKAA